MWEGIKRLGRWIAGFEAIRAIVQSDFVRTLLWPYFGAAMTAVAGYLQNVPWMWVIMASALTFMAILQGMLRGAELIDRKNPLNKLRLVETVVNYDLHPTSDGIVYAVRGAGAPPGPPRSIARIQLGVRLLNRASFPISVVIESAETEIEGKLPPRIKYPSPPLPLLPGTGGVFHDGTIDVGSIPCGEVTGKMDLRIKYGLPGKERFRMNFIGTIRIYFFPDGRIAEVRPRFVE
jgi:hypothetical protein